MKFAVASIRSIRESTRKKQRLGKRLTRRLQKIQVSKETEIELIFKTVRGKRKGNLFKRRN